MVNSKGHGSLGSSGIATPFLQQGDSSTPSSGTAVDTSSLTAKQLEDVDEKLRRRQSFTKAVLVPSPPSRGSASSSDGGPSKEHSEQGRVKRDVYVQYIEAASKIGFALFVVATILSQLVSVAANNTLRAWGEHNREAGSNKGVRSYLWAYGLFSYQ